MSISSYTTVTMLDSRPAQITITIPKSTDISNRIITFKDLYGSASNSTIVLVTRSGDTFEDGTFSTIMSNAYQTVNLYAGQPGKWLNVGATGSGGGGFVATATSDLNMNNYSISNVSSTLFFQGGGFIKDYSPSIHLFDIDGNGCTQTRLINGIANVVLTTTESYFGGNAMNALGNLNVTMSGKSLNMGSNNITLKDDYHGLVYGAGSYRNVGIDGPFLYGYSAGALGITDGGDSIKLSWDRTSVNINASTINFRGTSNSAVRIGPRQYVGTAADTTTYGLERSRHELQFAGYRDTQIDKIGSKIVNINKQTYGGPNQQLIQSADLAFFTVPPQTTDIDNTVERMRITDYGNIGINQSAPFAQLHIKTAGDAVGAGLWSGMEWTSNFMVITSAANSATPGRTPALGFGYSVANNTSYIASLEPFVAWRHLELAGSNIYLMTADGGSGNVGINTRSPAYKLDVAGSARMTSISTNSISTTTINAREITTSGTQLLTIGTNTTNPNNISFSNYGGSIGLIEINSYNIGIGNGQNGSVNINSGTSGYVTIQAANIWLQGTINAFSNDITNVASLYAPSTQQISIYQTGSSDCTLFNNGDARINAKRNLDLVADGSINMDCPSTNQITIYQRGGSDFVLFTGGDTRMNAVKDAYVQASRNIIVSAVEGNIDINTVSSQNITIGMRGTGNQSYIQLGPGGNTVLNSRTYTEILAGGGSDGIYMTAANTEFRGNIGFNSTNRYIYNLAHIYGNTAAPGGGLAIDYMYGMFFNSAGHDANMYVDSSYLHITNYASGIEIAAYNSTTTGNLSIYSASNDLYVATGTGKSVIVNGGSYISMNAALPNGCIALYTSTFNTTSLLDTNMTINGNYSVTGGGASKYMTFTNNGTSLQFAGPNIYVGSATGGFNFNMPVAMGGAYFLNMQGAPISNVSTISMTSEATITGTSININASSIQKYLNYIPVPQPVIQFGSWSADAADTSGTGGPYTIPITDYANTNYCIYITGKYNTFTTAYSAVPVDGSNFNVYFANGDTNGSNVFYWQTMGYYGASAGPAQGSGGGPH